MVNFQKHVDIFGFYEVGNQRFFSKLEAIEMQTKTGLHPHWNFNESVYNSCDWKSEPAETLVELYKRRAEQIREKYDYIVLWYSSGADSENVLKSFLDNNLKVDEIVSFINYQGDKNKDSNLMNGEIFNIAIPKMTAYKEKYPDLKFRIIDICQPTLNFFENTTNMLDWHYSMNCCFNPNATIRSRLAQDVLDWARIKDSGKKVVHVWGIDKPRIYFDSVQNKYYFSFIDTVDNTINPKWQAENIPGEFNELFYWSPDLPQIPIKQSHIIKQYLRKANKNSLYITNKKTNSLGYAIIDNKKFYISNYGVNFLIYPDYEYNFLNEFKPRSLLYTERDNWFFNLSENERAFTNWKSSLNALWKRIPDYWKNDPTDSKKGFKSSLSRPYYLE